MICTLQTVSEVASPVPAAQSHRSRLAAVRCILLCGTVGLGGCGHWKKPSTVVHSLYMDCNNHEYPKARNLLSAPVRRTSDGAITVLDPEIVALCDRLTESGTVSGIVITRELIRGDRALVIADIDFSSGTAHKGEATLLTQEKGAWKVTP
jgi:hypothetical protein